MIIDSFRGPYGFLSNFAPSPITWGTGPWTAPTAEHAFQARKLANPELIPQLLACATPTAAKRYGRAAAMRPDWEAVKLGVMRDVLLMKFGAGTHLSGALLATGDALLVEGNTWGDYFWGAVNGVGQNWLGHLLMARRAELRGGWSA